MFGELKLPTFQVEVIIPGFLVRAAFQPKGDLLIFLNDQRYDVAHFDEVAMYPIMPDAQVKGMKQEMMVLNKKFISGIALLEEERLENVMMLASKRPFVIYTEWFAIRGNLHVNADARSDDVFDETKDFFAMTDASIYPVRTLRKAPTRKVPLLTINRHAIYAYHPYQSDDR
ncbi:MAG: hypothetical protein H6662_14480 [Ardenticatenaceae bacterium]|nr:hypothetical protein [Anaerolineales bacterium]MCB8922791.1 hypothetical protein [Ardenticatenaceae bacterium]MCB8991924.1 hypothetical protein [Ardenticatenaceae bacterium]MCB9004734.1 hypothetical protein [Ardenticatenaceae bacterium]